MPCEIYHINSHKILGSGYTECRVGTAGTVRHAAQIQCTFRAGHWLFLRQHCTKPNMQSDPGMLHNPTGSCYNSILTTWNCRACRGR